jgi:IclR family KDG regulon transcriptional repressor
MAEAKPKKDQKEPGVQSIRRAFTILEAVSLSPEGLNLADLSKKVGLHNSTTFHLTKTMAAMGILRQNEQTKRYHVGAHLFALAKGAADESELVRLATPVIAALARETGENSHIAVKIPEGVVIIDKHESTSQVRMTERIGATRPAHATAIGKAILAALTDEQLEVFMEEHELEAFTPKTITDPGLFLQEIQQIRKNGIAYDDTEFNEEARCLAAPVFDFSGTVVGSIGISGPIWRVGLQELPALGKSVKKAATDLSAKLGLKAKGGKIPEKILAAI